MLKKKALLNLPVPSCPSRIPKETKSDYYKTKIAFASSSAIVEDGNTPFLQIAVYTRKRELIVRLFVEKDAWALYNVQSGKWVRTTLAHLLADGSYFCAYSRIYALNRSNRQYKSFLNGIGDTYATGTLDEVMDHVKTLRNARAVARREAEAVRKQERQDRIFDAIPSFPKGIDSYVRDTVLGKSKYIFYDPKEKEKTGYCTNCNSYVDIREKVRHKQAGVCPGCNSKIMYRSSGVSRSGLLDEATFSVMQKVPGKNIFYVCTYWAHRSYRHSYYKVKTGYSLASLSYFDMDNSMYTSYTLGRFRIQCGEFAMFISSGRWYENRDCYHNYDTFYRLPEASLFQTEQYDYFVGCKASSGFRSNAKLSKRVNYMCLIIEKPSFEYIYKCGFTKIANQIATSSLYSTSLNMKGKTMQEVFGLPRQDISLIREHDLDANEVDIYKELIARGFKRNGDTIYWARNLRFATKEFYAMLDYSTPQRIRNYYEKQRTAVDWKPKRYVRKVEKDEDYTLPLTSFLTCWTDYIRMAKEVEYDLTKHIILYPRNIKQIHDELHQTIALAKQEKESQIVSELSREFDKKLAYMNDQFMIRAAQNVGELVDEGKELEHCVGRYAYKIVEGKSVILFVRRRSEPDTPLCTVEFHRNSKRVGQCSGVDNKLEDDAVRLFIDEWKQAKKIA